MEKLQYHHLSAYYNIIPNFPSISLLCDSHRVLVNFHTWVGNLYRNVGKECLLPCLVDSYLYTTNETTKWNLLPKAIEPTNRQTMVNCLYCNETTFAKCWEKDESLAPSLYVGEIVETMIKGIKGPPSWDGQG
mgnify:CR=1 FL=1